MGHSISRQRFAETTPNKFYELAFPPVALQAAQISMCPMLLAVVIVFLVPATLAAMYYFTLTLIGIVPARRIKTQQIAPIHKITVLIPAHDEEQLLASTLESIAASDYPKALLHVVVVADNCTDRTAEVAASHGAEVLIRANPDALGKGYALTFGFDRILPTQPDAIVVLDADCEVTSGLLRRFNEILTAGADAAQAAVLSRNGNDGASGYVAALGGQIDRTLAIGLERVVGSVPLRGTGMLFRTALLERIPWSVTGLTEDAEYRALLGKAGIRVWHIADESILCQAPSRADVFLGQRRRWRASLRVRDTGIVSRLLASKPLVLCHLFVTTLVVGVSLPFVDGDETIPMAIWLAVVWLLIGVVYSRAMIVVGRNGNGQPGLVGLVMAFGLVAKLAWITLCGLWRSGGTWRRTPRAAP